jgi:predicted nucleic acid-binding protein
LAICTEIRKLPTMPSGPTTSRFSMNRLINRSRVLGPKQLTDIYLLALAVKHGGRLVTFDRGIPTAAVRGAQADHVMVI